MKRHQHFLITLFSFLALSTSALSAQIDVCPAVKDIKTVGLNEVERFGEEGDPESVYAAYSVDQYKTNHTWFFGISIPLDQASSTEDAMNKARDLLQTLSGDPKPQYNDKDDIHYCLYKVKGDYNAMAQVLSVNDGTDSDSTEDN